MIQALERAIATAHSVPGPLIASGTYDAASAFARRLRWMGYGPVYAAHEDPRPLPN